MSLIEIKRPAGRWGQHKRTGVIYVAKHYIRLILEEGDVLPEFVSLFIDREQNELHITPSVDDGWKVRADSGKVNIALLDVPKGVYGYSKLDESFVIRF